MPAADPLALYVHIPFCTAKCTYCDFNSYAGQDSLMAPYAGAVALEAAMWAPLVSGRRVATVFFGGGTPSLMPLDHMKTIVDALRRSFDIVGDAEVSLEANPGSVDLRYLEGLRALGFNRLSFGVQSFHDAELLDLERIHSGEEAEQAYRWARRAGFENVNLDLIFGLIGQTMEQWQANLERAVALAPEHLSLYALTLEEGTPLTRDVGRGRKLAPDPDLQADMYEWSRGRLRGAGYLHYEVSNWARPGRECRHNLAYWRNQDWLGLGAGAHSHLFGRRFAAAATPSRYIALVQETASSAPAASLMSKRRRPSPPSLRGRRPALSLPGRRPALSLQGRQAPLSLRGRKPEATLDAARSNPPPSLRGHPAPLPLRGRKPEATFDPPSDVSALDDADPFAGMRQLTFHDAGGDDLREMSETVILGLRLREGVSLEAFEHRFGIPLDTVFADALAETQDLGLTEVVDGRLRLRAAAVLLGDEAFMRFLPPSTVPP